MTRYLGLWDRESVLIEVFVDRIDVINDVGDVIVRLPKPFVSFETSGQNNDFIRITTRGSENFLLIQDMTILDVLKGKKYPGADQIERSVKRRAAGRLIKWGAPIGATVFALFVLPYLISNLPSSFLGKLFSFQSELWVQNYFIDSVEHLSDSEANKWATDLLDRLKSQNPAIPRELKVLVANDDAANAFALPGLVVFLNKGLINRASSTEEVMGVLGHEVGHVMARHPLRLMIRKTGNLLGYAALSLIVGADAAGSVLSGVNVIDLGYSRNEEGEADYFAVGALGAVGCSVDGFVEFFERQSHSNGVFLKILSTHPMPEERVNELIKHGEAYPRDQRCSRLPELITI